MTNRRTVNVGTHLEPHYKVRLVLSGWCIHVASRIEPTIQWKSESEILDVDIDIIEDHRYGDTLGYIDWSQVTGVSWRYSE